MRVAEVLQGRLTNNLDKAATDALVKSGGAIDNVTGQPLLSMSQLTNAQKSAAGELFGENTVKQIVPEGTKLARVPGVGETGIDDLYKVSRPDVDYVNIEYKFVTDPKKAGSSSLDSTLDGKQGSQSWLMGSDRLERSVGADTAIDVRKAINSGRTETWVVRTYADGSTEIQVLDAMGKPKIVDTSKLLPSWPANGGAKP